MRILAVIFGIVLIVLVAQDAFETIVLPRRVTRRIRLARLFYRLTPDRVEIHWPPDTVERKTGVLSCLCGPTFLASTVGVLGSPLRLWIWAGVVGIGSSPQ